jgi:hypothetical protein
MLQTLEIVLRIFSKTSLQSIGSDRPSIDPKKKKQKNLVTCIVLLYLSSSQTMKTSTNRESWNPKTIKIINLDKYKIPEPQRSQKP